MDTPSGAVKIVKVGQIPPLLKATRARLQSQTPTVVKHTSKHRTSQPTHGVLKRGRTARATPRFTGVRDPTSSPPSTTLRRGRRTSRLRILTEHGARTRRASIDSKSTRKPIAEIRAELAAQGLTVRDRTPDALIRTIHKDAQEAGMISSG